MGSEKIVMDTNILISALGWTGPPEECLELVLEGEVINCVSQAILDELSRVMDYPKFEFEREEKERFLEVIISRSILVTPSRDIEFLEEDPADNKFLECAVEAKACFIVSGDLHLLELKEFEGIIIVDPAAFLKRAG